jgi:hypothetical protein
VILIVRTAVTVFCSVTPRNLDTDVSEERTASIYKIVEYSSTRVHIPEDRDLTDSMELCPS